MQQAVFRMYERMFNILRESFGDYDKALEHLMELLVVDKSPFLLPQLEHRTKWLLSNNDLADKLMAIYDSGIRAVKPYDYLGQLCLKYNGRLTVSWAAKVRSEKEVRGILEKASIESTVEKITVLDPSVGTGRTLIAIHELAPNARLFGVEKDIRVLRVAITNCAIYRIKAYLLHADPLVHEIDITKPVGRYNWLLANSWDGSWHKLSKKI